MRRGPGLLLAVCLAVFTIATAPHRVHHLFEPEHTERDCPFATVAERIPADTSIVVALAAHETAPTSVVPLPTVALPSTASAPTTARAPPSLSS
jgi:hypothetical protein